MLKELLESGMLQVARLPAMNYYLLNKDGAIDLAAIDSLSGYTVPLISHDYAAKTPLMWNTVYEKLDLNLRNIMVVGDPKNVETILSKLREDPKYIGGGCGVGFKEVVIPYLDKTVPGDLKSVNIIVKEAGNLVGYNTDAAGFVKSLEDKLSEAGKKLKGSTIVLFGAGGVAKEVTQLLADKGASRISIINRTYSKAVELANDLNKKYGDIAVGVGEDMLRGVLLNSFTKPDAAINLTDKGSDGPLSDYAAFAPADQYNETTSRSWLRELHLLNHNIVLADIVISKEGKTKSLRLAELAGFKYLLDGIPMVVNQAAPAYKLVEKAHSRIHTKSLPEEGILEIMKDAASQN